MFDVWRNHCTSTKHQSYLWSKRRRNGFTSNNIKVCMKECKLLYFLYFVWNLKYNTFEKEIKCETYNISNLFIWPCSHFPLKMRCFVHGSSMFALDSYCQDMAQDISKIHSGGNKGQVNKPVWSFLHPIAKGNHKCKSWIYIL